MFFYIVLTPISTTSVYEVPAIRVNTTKSTYTFTSVFHIAKFTFHIFLPVSVSILFTKKFVYLQFHHNDSLLLYTMQ